MKLGRDPLEPVEVVQGVEHDVPDPGLDRFAQLALGLGVAVQVDPSRIETRSERQGQLAA
jgi:hypothetical protein